MIGDIGCVPMLMDPESSKKFVVEQNDIFRKVGVAIGIVK